MKNAFNNCLVPTRSRQTVPSVVRHIGRRDGSSSRWAIAACIFLFNSLSWKHIKILKSSARPCHLPKIWFHHQQQRYKSYARFTPEHWGQEESNWVLSAQKRLSQPPSSSVRRAHDNSRAASGSRNSVRRRRMARTWKGALPINTSQGYIVMVPLLCVIAGRHSATELFMARSHARLAKASRELLKMMILLTTYINNNALWLLRFLLCVEIVSKRDRPS